MRVGVSSYAFPRAVAAGRMDVDGLLAWAVEQGADAVQFCENLPWPLDRPAPSGLMVETGCRGIGDHLIGHLRSAQRTGSGFVRLVVDDGDDRPDFCEARDRLREYVARFRHAGVILALENHDRLSAATLRSLVVELGSDAVGVALDTANSLGSLEGLGEVTEALGPYVVNLHAKDVRAVRKADMLGFEVEGTVFGKGSVRLEAVLPELPRLRSVTLEQWVPAAADAVERELDWARTGLRRLRETMDRWNEAGSR